MQEKQEKGSSIMEKYNGEEVVCSEEENNNRIIFCFWIFPIYTTLTCSIDFLLLSYCCKFAMLAKK